MSTMTKIHEKTDDGWRINLVGCTDVIKQEVGHYILDVPAGKAYKGS